MTSRECEGTLSLVTEFEEDCKEKESMLEDIEDEVRSLFKYLLTGIFPSYYNFIIKIN